MPDDSPAPESTTSPAAVPAESAPELPPTQTETPSAPSTTDRTELLQRARAFLSSPQVSHEDIASKRRFLAEKGLTEPEVDGLLYEMPAPAPALPPRTYPQPPPSKVPYLLLNVLRAFTWVAGGSAALLLAYFRFLYPRISQTYQARLSLRSHRSALLERLNHSLEDLKATQRSTFAVLPQPEPFREPTTYAECHGLDQLAEASGDERDIPHATLLRCAIEECSKERENATSAAIFRVLEAKFPWVAEEGAQHEDALWRTLTTTPLFQPAPTPASPTTPLASTSPSSPSPDTTWTYTPPPAQPPTPLLSSLTALSTALPPSSTASAPTSASTPASKFQHTFQALSNLTGYIATQTYALPSSSSFRTLGGAALSPEEEDVRREIRALKGLVLNRRSFMPRAPRVSFPGPGAGAGAGAGVAVDGAAAAAGA